jgi:acyl-CoA thioester hydrolase
MAYEIPIHLRWADLDPNGHLKHSSYYDFGATSRMQFLDKHGLNLHHLTELGIGPILLREQAIFKREVRWGDDLLLDMTLLIGRRDFSRWTLKHCLWKDEGTTLCAEIEVDGAWLDLSTRKMAVPPEEAKEVFELMPRDKGFVWE